MTNLRDEKQRKRNLKTKTHLSKILQKVQQGHRFYITKHGKRIAELSPVKSGVEKPKFGCGKGTFTYVAADFDAPLKEFKAYMP